MNMPLPGPAGDCKAPGREGRWLARRVDAMARTARHPLFWLGVREMAGVSVGMAAWAFMTGVAMVASGLTVFQSVLMSLTVFSGSTQLAVLPLLASGAALWVVWLAGFCVCLRFVVFSLHLRDYFIFMPRGRRMLLGYLMGDVSYVLYTRHFTRPAQTPRQQRAHVAYLWGCNGCLWLSWQVMSLLGIFLGAALPERWGLEYAGTLALLALTCSIVTTRLRLLAAVLAGAVAVLTPGLPYNLNIVVAIVVAVAACLLLEPLAGAGRKKETARG